MVSSHLQQCLTIVEACTRGGGDECRVRRNPEQWSVCEVVEHLQKAFLGTAKGLERCVDKGATMATASPPFRQRVQVFVLLNLGYFPEGRQAPKHIIPTGELDLHALLDAVRRDLERLDAAAIRARERFGKVRVMDHPILGPFTIDQWLKFHLVHTRHHEKQIRSRR